MGGLVVESAFKRLGDRDVLRGIGLEAAPGTVLAIIGPSGCGKTTLLRCILGEMLPDRGRIVLDGSDVTSIPVESRGVGIVYQGYALFPHMTVAENVGYGLAVRRVERARARARIAEMLDLVQLGGREDAMPESLSGGERQRVALARALAVEPRLLLLDEAFSALDATTRSEVVREVSAIIRRLRLTTLLVTHDQEEAFLFADRVLVLNEGTLVVEGTPATVMAHPHPFIQGFVKMVLVEEREVETDSFGRPFVALEDGVRFPVEIPGVAAGDRVQVVIKKSSVVQTIEVRPRAPS
ncbi:ABC transporter ATP-binding protein [bacterium]|nr:ABC transporter ATP-binding protein [bacterium]